MSSTEMKDIERQSKSSSSSDAEPDDKEEVAFIQPNSRKSDIKESKPKEDFNGLSKEEVMMYAKDPFWRKIRIIMLILFWVTWIALIVASILIIIFTPKCPPVPKRKFWQKSSGYLLDVVNFKDTNGDGYGDLKGVIDNVEYLEKNGNHFVLASVIKGSLGVKDVRAPAVTDFTKVDEKVGTIDDIKKLLKSFKRKQLHAVIEIPIHTGKDHEWFKKAAKGDKKYKNYYIWNSKADSKMVNRVGKPVWNKVGSEFYWSSLHETVPALNLRNSDVLGALKAAVQFWLKEGFSGIFLNNVAFLAPDLTTKTVGSGLDVSTIKTGDLKKWYGSGHKGQLMSSGAVDFVGEVRGWVNEMEKQTAREILLLASPGNTGLQLKLNETRALLGDDKKPGAHSVIAMDLVPAKGAKVIKPKPSGSLRENLDVILAAPEGITLVTQTMAGPRQTDAVSTYLNLLLPTTALSLYGEEIGMPGYGGDLKSTKTFGPPFSFLTKAALKDAKAYKDDLFDGFDVPMQWTPSGGFSSNITYNSKNNVMMESTLGREMTRYKVFLNLVKLREDQSLNWGALEWIESQEEKEPNHFIFTRTAPGFPKMLVVLIRGTKMTGGLVRNLKKVCPKATARLAVPPTSDFKPGNTIPLKNLYFRFSEVGSAFIFKCA